MPPDTAELKSNHVLISQFVKLSDKYPIPIANKANIAMATMNLVNSSILYRLLFADRNDYAANNDNNCKPYKTAINIPMVQVPPGSFYLYLSDLLV